MYADLASTDRKARIDAVGELVADGSNAAHGVLKIYVRDKDAIIAGMCIDAVGRFGWEEDLPLFDELLKTVDKFFDFQLQLNLVELRSVNDFFFSQ